MAGGCRKCGISDGTYYNWKKRYEGLGVEELRRLRSLEEENRTLKKLRANQLIDIDALKALLEKYGQARLAEASGGVSEIRRLAFRHRRWGYRTIWRRLRLDGWVVNHKRVARLYREEGLALRLKPRGHRLVRAPKDIQQAVEPNQRWGMDFIQDAL